MKNLSSYQVITSYLPSGIKNSFDSVPEADREYLSEVRLRVNRPVSLVYPDRTRFLRRNGMLTSGSAVQDLVIVSRRDIEEIVKALCGYSVHSCNKELSEGYFTIGKGVRVGLAGARYENSKVIKNINSLNFRIARELKGCADELWRRLFSCSASGVLICGGTNSGKTTLLRDICRLCGDKYKTVLIDERNEISASNSGEPSMNIGVQTDVLEGYERASGITAAIRTLSPHLILCDEICTNADAEAILSGFGCGIKFISTIHAENYEDLLRRRIVHSLLEAGVFEYAVFMQGEGAPGRIREYRRLK